jgi:hypothetical protein
VKEWPARGDIIPGRDNVINEDISEQGNRQKKKLCPLTLA